MEFDWKKEEEFNKIIGNPLFKENMEEMNKMIENLEQDNIQRKGIVKGMDRLLKTTLLKNK